MKHLVNYLAHFDPWAGPDSQEQINMVRNKLKQVVAISILCTV
jgi:hypothetical protein